MGLFTKIKQHQGKVGGGFYFISVFSLLLLSALCLGLIYRAIVVSELPQVHLIARHFLLVFGGVLIGTLFKGRISVFFHELKHSIVSSLAGNKSKGMKIEDETGHFAYSFTKDTSHLNAFISLAPYTFPLFSLATLPFFAILYSQEIEIAKALISVALGLDLILNFRDAGPHQSDFYEVRGGFAIGLIYMLCFNFIMASIISVAILYGLAAFSEYGIWLLTSVTSFILGLREA